MSANRVELGILSFKSEAPVNGLGSNKSVFSCVFNLLWLSCGISASQELEGYRCSLLNTAQVCFPWRFSLFFFSFWFEGWESFSSWPHSGVVDLGFVWGLGFVFSVLVSLGGGRTFLLFDSWVIYRIMLKLLCGYTRRAHVFLTFGLKLKRKPQTCR